MEDNISGYLGLKEKLMEVKTNINSSNFRKQKDKIIQIRQHPVFARLIRQQRLDLEQIINVCFEKINKLRDTEQKEFEMQAVENYERIKPLVDKALLEAQHSDDIHRSWEFCIQVQNEFKGIKLSTEKRELLYGRLQEAFDLLKQKRELQQQHLIRESVVEQKNLLPKIEALKEQSETTNDLSGQWGQLIEFQNQLRERNLTYEVRNVLRDKLQEAFSIIKIRREKEKALYEENALDNAVYMERLIQEGENLAAEAEDYKMVFSRLREIQEELRGLSIERSDRQILYDRLQAAYEIIKKRQDHYFAQKEKESDENYYLLKPLVSAALAKSRTSNEFKKTREMLIRLQSQFKGIKMKPDKRQELYSQLQQAFDLLNVRNEEYMATKKDKMEMRLEYQLSDIELRLQQIKEEIQKNLSQLEELSDAVSNPLVPGNNETIQDIQNQLMVMKASLKHKQKIQNQLLHERDTLEHKKQKWDNIGNVKNEGL